MEFVSGKEYLVDAKLGGAHDGASRFTVKLSNVIIDGTVVTADFGDNEHGLKTMRGCTGCDVFMATISEATKHTIPIEIFEVK